ncbi:MAG TPA: peptidoglycan DD-metalloendopeptidase family protein [Anaerolineales bacterium]|jgi:murein DD-endopeptidase MepM/ murein hydrolase activator NlpD|nr:peptidoglycan DD-metalloendopeptidase family protein [Anaerolineales bacterium]
MKNRTQLLLILSYFAVAALVIAAIGINIQPAQAGIRSAQEPESTPTLLPDPLSSPLPEASNNPKSAWRPPLYPVPWALSENDHFYFVRPVKADEVNWPLSSYRYGGIFFAPDAPHTGVDIVVGEGTPVYAAGPGQVIWSGKGLLFGDNNQNDPYGFAVAIEHDFGWNNEPLYTLYAHLSETLVDKGAFVETGDLIALSGGTGMVTAPHLHFEVRVGTNNFYETLNPELWLAPPQGWGVIVGRLTDGIGEPLLKQEVILTNMDTGQEWRGKSYGSILTVNGDPHYNENFAISDLPAGNYRIQIPYFGYMYEQFVEVHPGRISYFRYRGLMGFSDFTPNAGPPSSIESFLDSD